MQSLFIHSYITWLIFHVRGIPVRLHSKELHRFLTNEHNWRKEFCKNPLLVLRLHALFNVCRKPCKIIIMHSFSCGVAVTVYTLLHMWLDLEKNCLPHTQDQTYNFAKNIKLLAQYTIIFYCVSWSEIKSMIFVAAYLWPCVSLEWCSDAIGWSWLSWNGVQMAG